MRLSIALPLIAVTFLSGCASTPNLMTQRLAATPVAEHAYMIGTYVISCEPRDDKCNQVFNSLSTYYRATDNKDVKGSLNSVYGSIFGDDTSFDFVDSSRKEKGFHFCVALPPGSYTFHSYDFYSFAGGGSGYSLPEGSQFNLPFSVAAGEVAYVGRLKLTTAMGKNIFGLPLPAPGILLLSSDPTAMQNAALQKCPDSARSKPIKNAVLKVAATNDNPSVQIEPQR